MPGFERHHPAERGKFRVLPEASRGDSAIPCRSMGDVSTETTVRVVAVEHAGEVRLLRLIEARDAERLLLAVLVQEPEA